MKQELWHHLSTKEVYDKLQTSKEGLTSKEAKKRIEKYGKNELPRKKTDSIFKICVRQILDPIVMLLIVTIIFSFIIKEYVDAGAIIFIVIVDLIIGTYQEWKAQKTAESLSKLIKVQVKVRRDGRELEVDSSELTVGDIVLLESGNKVSADLRLIEAHNLTIDESILTGESVSIVKTADTLEEKCLLAERKNMVYAGTSVITGRGEAIVVACAVDMEIGKIASTVTSMKEEKSPLTIRMEKFSKQISILVIIIAIILTILLIYKGFDGKEIFLSVIALSVSAMPEGLPLALTMALTIASNRMAKKNVVVKKLNSVESLGSCTVIASDKTGTLTVNEQTAKKILLPNGNYFDVGGTGYNDKGKITPSENAVMEDAYRIGLLGVLNNEAGLEFSQNKWHSFGDSIDIAFLALGKKLKINKDNITILGEIPYESENKYSAVFYQVGEEIRCTVKGSIEKVMEFSSMMHCKEQPEKLNKDFLLEQNNKLAKDGYRIIALADGLVKNFTKKEIYKEEDIPSLTFEGMVAFIDPIREEVKSSLKECETAGIKVVMITGDHPLTAFAISKELGLAHHYEEVTSGEEVEEVFQKGEKAFDAFVSCKRVFTRVTPLQKLEIVESFKRQGEFVAVTGDGVNDAPAIRAANIGVAMGSGTDVAKETASMIVMDDNFKSIVTGVKEGRNAYSNIRKVSYLLLSCGLAEVLFFVLAIMFDLPMPLVAIQLLWLNIVTDGLQDLALSFEKAEDNIMKEPPRDTKESVFNKELMSEVLISGLLIGILVFVVWFFLLNYVHMEEKMARGYIMALMVFMQNIHVLNCRSEKQSAFRVSLWGNPFVVFSIVSAIVLQIIIMEVDIFSKFLQTSTIPIPNMILLFAVSMIVLLCMEIYKKIRYKTK